LLTGISTMAHFFFPPDQTPTNFFHVAVDRPVTARLGNAGGPDLQLVDPLCRAS
jgi:hypothetical protein